MPIPPEINSIVKGLNQELDEIEQQATEGQNVARKILDSFPNNARLVGSIPFLHIILSIML